MITFITAKTPAKNTDCLCVAMYNNESLNDVAMGATLRDALVDLGIENIIKQGDFRGKLASTHLISTASNSKLPPRVLLIGLGDRVKFDKRNYVKVVDAMIGAVNSLPISHLTTLALGQANELIDEPFMWQQLAFKWVRQGYQFNQQTIAQNIKPYAQSKTEQEAGSTIKLQELSCLIDEATTLDEQQVQHSLSLGDKLGIGVNTTRFLGDLPANICTPIYLAEFAEKMGEQYQNLEVRIKDEAEMQQLGMDLLLSVSRGSKEEAKFIEIEYIPSHAKHDETVVLVGKGVTFDTGGISLKPSGGMDEMKYDMCGAASVFGTMHFLGESSACATRVIAIIPATENMPSSCATKPGDVFTSYSGQTVEILNTDAEGRLILADSLSYAEATYQPSKMINVATLTGACIIALGNHRSAVMSNQDDFAQELMAVGQSVLDPCWQLPLDDEYDELLHSNFANMANIGGRPAGSITAGCFLKRFVKNTTWAHLDIAGVAWLEGKKKGATGRPVPLLVNWLLEQYS